MEADSGVLGRVSRNLLRLAVVQIAGVHRGIHRFVLRGRRARIVGDGVDVTVTWRERMDDTEVLWGAKEDFAGDCAKEDEGVVGLEDDSLFSCSAVAVIGYFDNVANSDVGWMCALWRRLGYWVGLS